MTSKHQNPRKALNKSFLKVKPSRSEIEKFKTNLLQLLSQINQAESEEFHKNIISKFLDTTYYAHNHYINTKGRNDLVIHNGKDAKTTVGVIIEAKKPSNAPEMLRADNINTKALQELVLYYLRERITGQNLEVKHLIVTDIQEWFIFDANIFEKAFAENKALIKQFNAFEEGRLSGKSTDFFYKEIAKPAIDEFLSKAAMSQDALYTYFDIREYDKPLRNTDKKDDSSLIVLYKLLSPEHLLKLPFLNDNNTLDKNFYSELLHIIGLKEVKRGSKKVIERNSPEERDEGSLIENVINQLDALDKISRLENSHQFGTSLEERQFNVALELVITWVNRVLFLKLLEAQLISYHKGDKSYSFLNKERIKNFDDLNSLFFQVLARRIAERNPAMKAAFGKIPYLNSSLFEPTDIEHKCLFMSQLADDIGLPLLTYTVLKDNSGKKKAGKLSTLEYLFSFLDSYDFSSESSEEIQEDNKTLINAAVLGLIFEKINGYKDGSFFTPGFITMYMCRETIRKVVVQKFNVIKGWQCSSIDELYNKIEDKREANDIINSLKICDPAVGSGHFLVSALNEIIAIKSGLKILLDRDGKTLRDYHAEVSNDELLITDEEGNLFKYNPHNKESQRVQEALFHEKQALIESCLFGVDINANSVKICRLRLWIELLKNAYYKTSSNYTELETLPNIDINIKCGNSLVSRFSLDADLSVALKKSKLSIDSYKQAVQNYRHATSKEQKREMESLIVTIKSNFRTEINSNDVRKLNSKQTELSHLLNQQQLFELSKAEKASRKQAQGKLEAEIDKIALNIEEIKTNKIFENSFEWRFEFPEVLNESGDFVGFDVVIANPPYLPLEFFSPAERDFFREKYSQFERKFESSVLFISEGFSLLKKAGFLSYIAPATWQTGENYLNFRKAMIEEKGIYEIINLPFDTFEDAYVDTSIYLLTDTPTKEYRIYNFDKKDKFSRLDALDFTIIPLADVSKVDYKVVLDKNVGELISQFLSEKYISLGEITKSTQGLSGSQFSKLPNQTKGADVYPFLSKGNAYNYALSKEEVYLTDLQDKKSLKQFYEAEPKLLIRRIINRQDRLSVAFTSDKLVFKKDINPFIVTDDRFDTKFLLGVMASKLISYLYLNMSSIAKKDDFRQTTLGELRKLPIPIADERLQKSVISIVDKILTLKASNPETDASALETELDYIVYSLYDLAADKIKLIEKIYGQDSEKVAPQKKKSKV